MSMQFPDSCIIQFAKAPVLGHVKTRLQPRLSEAQSLALHKRLVEQQFHHHRQSSVAHFELWYGANHTFFYQLSAGTGIPLTAQRGHTLGERMANTFADRLNYYRRVIIIGSDCPALDGDYITGALDALNDDVPAVFGPATDGGYVLVGLKRLNFALFKDIPWGSDQVMSMTRTRLESLGWPWHELAPLTDIDRPEDLYQLSPVEMAALYGGDDS